MSDGQIDQIPAPAELFRRCQIFAAAEAVAAGEESGWRGMTFHPQWRADEDLVQWQDGCGGEWSILFSDAGCFLRGADAKSAINRYNERDLWPGLVDGLPKRFSRALAEPDFYDWYDGVPRVTACVWRTAADDQWRCGDIVPVLLQGNEYVPDQDGVECGAGGDMWLFWNVLRWTADEVLERLDNAEEHEIPLEAVERMMRFEPLTEELLRQFHPEPDLAWIRAEAEKIGYPVSP